MMMMMITDFEIRDFGIDSIFKCPDFPIDLSGYQHSFCGAGTDAESALDDLLEGLSVQHDITGLEGRIKSEWNPSMEEGDGEDTHYKFGILFNEGW